MKLLRSLAVLLAVLAVPLRAQPARHPDGRPLSVIAFGSCAEQTRPQPIWDAVLAQKPGLFLFLGDNIYADTEDMAVMDREYARLDRIPGFRRLRRTTPLLAVWDDHDFGVNDGGREYPQRDASQDRFLRFWREPAASPRWRRPGLYDARVFGPPGRRVQVLMLDTRYFRSPLKPRPGGESDALGRWIPDDDPAATMLGEAQWTWLEDQLKVPAELRLLVSSVQVVADDHGWEKWGNLPRERARLFDTLKRSGAEGVVVLSGDRHFAELHAMDAGLGYPLYDFTSSGLNQAGTAFRWRPGSPTRVAMQGHGQNFGVVRIAWDRPGPRLWLESRDEQGAVRFAEPIPLSLLRRKAAGSSAAPAPPPAKAPPR
jgi:alkaline phosphatase D